VSSVALSYFLRSLSGIGGWGLPYRAERFLGSGSSRSGEVGRGSARALLEVLMQTELLGRPVRSR